ncbi:hypothetical protein D3C79_1050650 [compost metagenome]
MIHFNSIAYCINGWVICGIICIDLNPAKLPNLKSRFSGQLRLRTYSYCKNNCLCLHLLARVQLNVILRYFR